MIIFNNAKDLRELNVHLSNDLSKEEHSERKKLRSCLQDLRDMQKNAHIKGKLIETDGIRYTLSDALELVNKAQSAEMNQKLQDPKVKQSIKTNSLTPRKRALSINDVDAKNIIDRKKSKKIVKHGNMETFLSPKTTTEPMEHPAGPSTLE